MAHKFNIGDKYKVPNKGIAPFDWNFRESIDEVVASVADICKQGVYSDTEKENNVWDNPIYGALVLLEVADGYQQWLLANIVTDKQ